MIKLYDKKTGEQVGAAIKYDRMRRIEYNMFGVTGTEDGRQTKVDCQGTPLVKNGNIYERVKAGNFVVQTNGWFRQMSVYTMLEQFDFELEGE